MAGDSPSRSPWFVPIIVAAITALGAIGAAYVGLNGLPFGPTASSAPAETGPDIEGRYTLGPASRRVIVIAPSGKDYTISEQPPALWPFQGTVAWVGGQRFEGPASFMTSNATMNVRLERMADGTLSTRFEFVKDEQGAPSTRVDEHTLVPVR